MKAWIGRRGGRAAQYALDLAVLISALFGAVLLRFDGLPPATIWHRLTIVAPYVVGIEFAVLLFLGVHRFAWKYVGLREAVRILVAVAISSSGLLILRILVGELDVGRSRLAFASLPISVIAGNFILSFVGLSGMRFLRRMVASSRRTGVVSVRPPAGDPVPTLLIGAGQAGLLVAREIQNAPYVGLRAVAFLDDDKAKHGTLIHGVPVLGSTAELGRLSAELGVKQVLITIANAPGKEIRRIRSLCEDAGLTVKIVPGLYEIVGGTFNLSRIRDVAIEDLLGREPVSLDIQSIASLIEGRTVLVTGAGGSIGSELCRQLVGFPIKRLIAVDQSEFGLFNIHRELVRDCPDVDVRPRIADVTDAERMRALFEKLKPHVVLHAAAHKHVPMMEWNPGEAVKNNVRGTRTVADLSVEFGVETMVLVSTDKAVNPTSVMGATKRAAEMYCQSLTGRSHTKFVAVRFGNVLGSAGSVVPIFKEQIERGGPITITHPDMKRYFMTIPEACQLVLQAASMGHGGEIFVLDMGEPVRIVDLATDLIRLSGLRPGEDIEIEFSGMRPGEKLFEELGTEAEQASKTRHPKIFVGRIAPHLYEEVVEGIERATRVADGSRPDEVVAALVRMIPEYRPERSIATDAPPPVRGSSPEHPPLLRHIEAE